MPHVDTAGLHTCNDHCARSACVERRFIAKIGSLIQCSGTYEQDASELFDAFDIHTKGTVERLQKRLNRLGAEKAPARAAARKASK